MRADIPITPIVRIDSVELLKTSRDRLRHWHSVERFGRWHDSARGTCPDCLLLADLETAIGLERERAPIRLVLREAPELP